LGLAHEHQNPFRRLRWRSDEEIRSILKQRLVEPIYDDFIAIELTRPWQGCDDFSYWKQPADPEALDLESVMTEPVYRCLLAHREPGHECLGTRLCRVEQALFDELQRPTAPDRERLLRIYAPLPYA
jgi:hypothetical protein